MDKGSTCDYTDLQTYVSNAIFRRYVTFFHAEKSTELVGISLSELRGSVSWSIYQGYFEWHGVQRIQFVHWKNFEDR